MFEPPQVMVNVKVMLQDGKHTGNAECCHPHIWIPNPWPPVESGQSRLLTPIGLTVGTSK